MLVPVHNKRPFGIVVIAKIQLQLTVIFIFQLLKGYNNDAYFYQRPNQPMCIVSSDEHNNGNDELERVKSANVIQQDKEINWWLFEVFILDKLPPKSS